MSKFADATDCLTGVPFALAWAAALAFCCAFWSACAWAAWQIWRLAGGG